MKDQNNEVALLFVRSPIFGFFTLKIAAKIKIPRSNFNAFDVVECYGYMNTKTLCSKTAVYFVTSGDAMKI